MKSVIDLMKLVFLIAFVCHIFSLFWYGLAITQIDYGRTDTWLNSKHLVEESTWVKYVYSFYFLSVTMITVGYGDITPQNYIEALFTVLIMFTTAIFWAFFLGKVGKIIDTIAKQDKLYNKNMGILHQMMREERVDVSLRIKISNYLSYFYKEFNETQKSQEKIIISKLSKQLQDQLILNIQGKYLKQIPFFEKLYSKKEIAIIMEEVIFSPGEYIYQKDDVDDCSLYLIVKGQVDIVFTSEKRGESIIQTLDKLKYFGEQSFISGFQRELSAKAATFCRVYKIPRNKFLETIKLYDFDKESFQMLQDALFLKQNYKFCNIRCQICQSYQHLPQNCPKTHFVLSKQALICRHNQSQVHLDRKQFSRKSFKFQSLNQIKNCYQAIFSINDNENFFEYLDYLENLIQSFDNFSVSEQEQEFAQIYEKEDKEEINEGKKRQKKYSSSKQSLFTKMTQQETLENFQAQQTYQQQQSNLESQLSSIQYQDEQQKEQEDDDQSYNLLNKSINLNNQINLQQKLNSEALSQINNQKAQQNQKKASFIMNTLNMQDSSNIQVLEGQFSPQSEQGNQVVSDYILNDNDNKSQYFQSNFESQNSLKSKFPSRLLQNNTEKKQTSFTSFKEHPSNNLAQKRQSMQESFKSQSQITNDFSQLQMSPQPEREQQIYKNSNYQQLHQYTNKSKLKQNIHQNPLSLHKIQNKHISSSHLQNISQTDILNSSKIAPQSISNLPHQIQVLIKQRQSSLGSEISESPLYGQQKIKTKCQDKEQILIGQLNDEQLMFISKQKYESNITESENNYFVLQFFEKAHIFKYYNPQSNYDHVIFKHQKVMLNNLKQRQHFQNKERKKSKFIFLQKN
ncbi:cyclic nucleotide-binding domain protein (macronuclear) [Tetrahymena thermophila SB210]|uniref:Cyclic nucleotide-binding domain protein n=1 Tax=Tetrahymena thermophila (strain SB210) TaxID=312017 RepID=Q236Y9_TETTS|nr:cyclic nucleotide-binding domain protein [Tetrahymena thermophila SB210]EAR92361.2 cyclic nucleotide-binding domain protein [Tetrahymena thermophila SB210]|eukprot:XP_001012606.2 cyclic nucleotide-binding domain protein [Tetrahymena thermophila SB210]